MIEFSERCTNIILEGLKRIKEEPSDFSADEINNLISRIENNNIDRHIKNIWRSMLDRCRNKKNSWYKNYGGRGITVCKEWHQLRNFKSWCLSNGYKIGLTIDRINVNRSYEPGNCRFATQKEQQRNKRSNRKLVDPFDGEMLCISEIAEKYNLNYHSLVNRLNRDNMSVKDAIVTPFRKVSKITDENDNKISICEKIIWWHDNNLKVDDCYSIQKMSEELNINRNSINAAVAPTHNKRIAYLLNSEFYEKLWKSPKTYKKKSNWEKDVEIV